MIFVFLETICYDTVFAGLSMLMLAWRKSFYESLNIVWLNLIFLAILVDIDQYSPRYRFIQNVWYFDILFYWTFGKRYWVSLISILWYLDMAQL